MPSSNGSHDSHDGDLQREDVIDIKATGDNCSKSCKTICTNLFILMFEFAGTFMLACVWQGEYEKNGGPFSLFIGFFIILIMGANISGAHFNPCVTAAFMFRRDHGKFKPLHGLFYILF
jgi:glycerol uptake facilitator-like aquaporin